MTGYDVIVGSRKRTPSIENLNYEEIDVTSEQSVKLFFSSLKVNKIDSIIYSAGTTTSKKSVEDFNVKEYLRVHDVNILGALLTLKYAYPLLKKAQGRVVIINSIAARTYSKFSGVEYTITKSGLSGMVKQLAIEWANDNVLINSIFPSMADTPMLRKNVDQTVLEPIENEIPLKRIAKPLEIASAIEFLISENNTYMTGSGLDINGGQYLNG